MSAPGCFRRRYPLPRPIIVLTPNRADDVYRQRFTAAHELGHLLLHRDAAGTDPSREREADQFVAEFLTPRDSILPHLPRRLDLRGLAELTLTTLAATLAWTPARCEALLGIVAPPRDPRPRRTLVSDEPATRSPW